MNVPRKTQGNKVQNGSKWVKFTYIRKETTFITKLLKNSSINVSYTTHNTISKLLSQQSTPKQNKFDGSGIYKLTCPDCSMKYVGQTGRSFRTGFSEHFRDFKYANHKSKFAQHLLDNNHSFGPIDNILEVLHSTSKGKLMDTLEKFHIYKITRENIQINDKNTSKPNAIFDTLIREEYSRQLTDL
jgi:transposase-like protein